MSMILEQASLTLLLMVAFVVHMTPTILAYTRSHPQKFLIAAINLVPGLGWFAGLALLTSSSVQLRRVMAEGNS